jgi:hypothetical protein
MKILLGDINANVERGDFLDRQLGIRVCISVIMIMILE